MTPTRPSRRQRRRRGFTLIELMITVAVLGTLATIAIPSYLRIQQRARIGEVKSNLAAIRSAQESYNAQYGTYVAAPVLPGGVLSPNKQAWPNPALGYDLIGWTPEGSVYFNYSVLTPAGCPAPGNPCPLYTAEGQSDLDGDGALNTWGYVNAVPGALSGIPGLVCVATGTYNSNSGALDRMNTVGPCSALDGTSVF